MSATAVAYGRRDGVIVGVTDGVGVIEPLGDAVGDGDVDGEGAASCAAGTWSI